MHLHNLLESVVPWAFFFFNTILKLIQDDRGAIVSHVTSLENKNNLLNRRLIEANRNLQYLTENTTKELETLKAANENELNFFNKNLEAIKV